MVEENTNENPFGFDDSELFSPDNVPKSNWFKFEKVGDRIAGEVIFVEEKESQGNFPAQRVITLKDKNGEVVKVALKKTSSYLMDKTRNLKEGDIFGAEFKAEIPSRVKGNHPAKSIEVYVIPRDTE